MQMPKYTKIQVQHLEQFSNNVLWLVTIKTLKKHGFVFIQNITLKLIFDS